MYCFQFWLSSLVGIGGLAPTLRLLYESFTLKDLPNLLKRRFYSAFWKSYLTKSMNVAEIFTPIFQQDDCFCEPKPPLKKP